jgi:hypothetical protein
MSIRTFGEKDDECWVCGWFDVSGKLIDLQQYPNKIQAIKCAERVMENSVQYDDGSWSEDSLFPFVGNLKMVL